MVEWLVFSSLLYLLGALFPVILGAIEMSDDYCSNSRRKGARWILGGAWCGR